GVLHAVQHQQERRFLETVQQRHETALVPKLRTLRFCRHALMARIVGETVQFGPRYTLYPDTGLLRQLRDPRQTVVMAAVQHPERMHLAAAFQEGGDGMEPVDEFFLFHGISAAWVCGRRNRGPAPAPRPARNRSCARPRSPTPPSPAGCP